MMVATYGLMFFSFKYFTAYIVTIPLFIYIDSYIFTRIFKSLENTNEQRAREEQEAAAEKLDEVEKMSGQEVATASENEIETK